jgi:hypothetical protein
MKIFLLIEPSILAIPLIFKAIEKNDKIFIISSHIDHFTSVKNALNVSSLLCLLPHPLLTRLHWLNPLLLWGLHIMPG